MAEGRVWRGRGVAKGRGRGPEHWEHRGPPRAQVHLVTSDKVKSASIECRQHARPWLSKFLLSLQGQAGTGVIGGSHVPVQLQIVLECPRKPGLTGRRGSYAN